MLLTWDQLVDPLNHIIGVELKRLVSHPDSRGYFREVLRVSDSVFQGSFAQWSHSKMAKNTVKAWHFHHRQIDWWYVGVGVLLVVLIDNREESPTYKKRIEFKLGDGDLDPQAMAAVVRIPQGVLHSCKVLSDGAHLFYMTSETYNPEDEGRIPFDAEEIGYNWGPEETLIVAARDKTRHIPPYPRPKV